VHKNLKRKKEGFPGRIYPQRFFGSMASLDLRIITELIQRNRGVFMSPWEDGAHEHRCHGSILALVGTIFHEKSITIFHGNV
jgi:hypothetical protein